MKNSGAPASAKSDVLAVVSTLLKWPFAWRLGAAIAAVLVGVAFRYFLFGGVNGHFTYVTFFPAVAVAAVVGGVAGGVLATILSAGAALMLTHPLSQEMTVLGLATFFFSSAIIVGVTALLRMALQRNAADDLFRQSAGQLAAFVENAPAAIAMFDANMRYLACSARWRSNYDLDRDVLGKSRYDVFPEIPDAWKEVHRRALLGETLRSEGDALTRADGSVQWVRWEVQPWRDPRGDIGGIVIFSEDITDELRTQELLRESEQRQTFLLDLGDALRPLRDPDEIVAVASELLGQRLGCNRVIYSETDDEQRFAAIRREWSDGAMPTALGVHRIADDGASLVALTMAGKTSAVDDIEQDPLTAPVAATFRARSIGAFVTASLVKEGRHIGVLSAQCARPRHWSPAEIELVEDVAERTLASLERERAEHALRDGVQRLHLCLRAASAGAWEWDMKTNDLVWSDELWEIYGLAPHSCKPTLDAWLQTIHPDDRDAIAKTVKDAVAKGDEITIEWRTADDTRGERWLLSRGGLLHETDQPEFRYLGVVIDITERKRAQQGLLESKAKLEAALASMTDAVFISDAEGTFTLLNEAFVAFHRFASKAECFERFSDYFALFQGFAPDGQELPPAQWPVSRALRGETFAGAEMGVRRRDTGERWLGSYSFAPIRNEAGAIVGSVVTARDITEKHKAEQDLRESERRFKAVFDTSMEGIVTIDKRGIIQSANPAAAAMFGYQTAEMLGHNIGMLMPEPDRAGHDSYVAQYPRKRAKTVVGRVRKLKGLRKNGEIFPNEITITDASDNQDPLFIGFIRDLTRIENEMRKTEAARAELLHVSRLSDMGEVAAGLAHEVSQPLTAIRILASSARRLVEASAEPSIARAIEVIEAEARNATELLKRLRGFIEKRDFHCYPEKLTELIEEALALASLRSSGRFVRIVSKLSPEDIDVNVDRIQIIQVLVNFLRNASDAMADQPDPEVVIESGIEKPGVVRVAVSDNGAGVDPKIADRLFTPFVTTKSYGMGVGLSLCKTIIESHQGEIGCAASTPKGAAFWFTLPIVERTAEADDPAADASGAVP